MKTLKLVFVLIAMILFVSCDAQVIEVSSPMDANIQPSPSLYSEMEVAEKSGWSCVRTGRSEYCHYVGDE